MPSPAVIMDPCGDPAVTIFYFFFLTHSHCVCWSFWPSASIFCPPSLFSSSVYCLDLGAESVRSDGFLQTSPALCSSSTSLSGGNVEQYQCLAQSSGKLQPVITLPASLRHRIKQDLKKRTWCGTFKLLWLERRSQARNTFCRWIKRLKCDAGVGDDVLASCFLAVACEPLHTSGNQSLLMVVVWGKLKRPTDAANVKDEDGGDREKWNCQAKRRLQREERLEPPIRDPRGRQLRFYVHLDGCVPAHKISSKSLIVGTCLHHLWTGLLQMHVVGQDNSKSFCRSKRSFHWDGRK